MMRAHIRTFAGPVEGFKSCAQIYCQEQETYLSPLLSFSLSLSLCKQDLFILFAL